MVTLIRNGKKKEISVKIGRLPSDGITPEETPQTAQGKWGLMFEDLSPDIAGRLGIKDDKGVIVSAVQPGSPADLAGIRRGDIILEVNQEPVDSVNDVKKQMAKAGEKDSLLLLVNRGDGKFFVGLSG
jgi:serine protease Do